MGTPSARFIIEFGADTSGIDKSKASMGELTASITKGTNALKEITDSMQRLKGTSAVMRWEGLPKDISKAENEVAKFAAKFAKLKADFDKAPAEKKEGLFGLALANQGELNKATARLAALKGEKDKLSKSEPVRLFEDLKANADKIKQGLGQSQTALSRLGGTMGEAKGAMGDLAAGADAAGLPTKGLMGHLKALGELGTAGKIALVTVGLLALAAAVVAVAATVAAGVVKVVAFAVSMSDAARSARLLREASAGSAAAADGLYDATVAVEEKTGAQRDTVAALANEYARMKLSLGAVEGATTAMTIATETMGSQVGSTIKGIVDRGMMMKRFWLNPLDLRGTGIAMRDVAVQLGKSMRIGVGAAETALRQGVVKIEDGVKAMGAAFEESPLGAIAKKQALALGVQFERAKDNIGRLFSGVAIEPFLEKLDSALDMFKETSATGKALKQAFTAIFQPFVDSATDSIPLVENLVLRTTVAALEMAVAFKEAGGFKAFFSQAKAGAEDLWSTLKEIASVVATIGKGLRLAKDVGSLLVVDKNKGFGQSASESFGAIKRDLGSFGDTAKADGDAKANGIAVAAGAAGGVMDGIAVYVKAIRAMAVAGNDEWHKANEMHSPSALYRRETRKGIGGGVEGGIEDSKPGVARALASLTSPPETKAAATAGASAAGGGSSEDRRTPIEFNYYGGGSRSEARRAYQYFMQILETETLAKGLRA